MSRNAVRIVLALLITAVSLYFAFDRIDLNSMLAVMRSANLWWIAASIIAMLFAHFSRAMRWRAMLDSLQCVGMWNSFSAVMIGYGINQVLPRGGELARPYVLGRRESLPPSTLLATVALERVIDVISLVVALIVSIAVLPGPISNAWSGTVSVSSIHDEFGSLTLSTVLLRMVLPTILGMSLLMWLFFTHRGLATLEWIAHRAPRKYHERLSAVIQHVRDGLHIVRSSGLILPLFVWTLAIWIGYGLMTWLPMFALHLDHYGLTFMDAFAIMSIITVGRSIAPTPGAIGVYHFFAINAMVMVYHIAAPDAAAFATISHGVPYLAMILLGAACWMVEEWRGVE